MNKVGKASVPQEVRALAAQVGELMHLWGFKKVHGRIWTLLFLSEAPLDAAAIMDSLKISKALTSLSLNELLKYELIVLEEKKSAAGTRLYRASTNPRAAILAILGARQEAVLNRLLMAMRSVLALPSAELQRACVDRSKTQAVEELLGVSQAPLLAGLLEASSL